MFLKKKSNVNERHCCSRKLFHLPHETDKNRKSTIEATVKNLTTLFKLYLKNRQTIYHLSKSLTMHKNLEASLV